MQSKLDRLKQNLKGNEQGNLVTSLYYLIKELKCLPEILGKEFEVIYEKQVWYKPWTWNRISKIIQKPISIPTLNVLMKEMEEDYKRQEKEAKKNKVKGRR